MFVAMKRGANEVKATFSNEGDPREYYYYYYYSNGIRIRRNPIQIDI